MIRGGLSEIRTIKNAYSEEMLEEQESFVESKSGDRVNLEELLFHLDENRRLRNIPGLKEHFWDMSVVDILIDNNDRNNGNWGLVFNGQTYKPIRLRRFMIMEMPFPISLLMNRSGNTWKVNDWKKTFSVLL